MIEERKNKKTQNSSLMGTLSVLGVLAIALTAGLLFMQKKNGSSEPLTITQLLEKQDEALGGEEPISWAKKGSSYPSSVVSNTPTPTEPQVSAPIVKESSGNTLKEFDPISWAREGRAYPPLQEEKSQDTEFVAIYSTRDVIPDAGTYNTVSKTESPSAVVVKKTPVKKSPAPKKIVNSSTPAVVSTSIPKKITSTPTLKRTTPTPTPTLKKTTVVRRTQNNTEKKRTSSVYQKIKENAYWVQVFSSDDASRAEVIRDELADVGLPAMIQTRKLDGHMWYRVRIGAFSKKNEAENYAETIRDINGYSASFIVLAPVTRQVSSY